MERPTTMSHSRLSLRLFAPSLEPWRANGRPAVAALMSGGVDSSVAALVLRECGWDVVGITMKVPQAAPDHPRPCCGVDAAVVCHRLGLPHYFVDVEGAFESLVVERFRRSYSEGRTPNPCVDCNSLVKFRLLWDFLERELGIRHLATGHYARVERVGGRCFLARARCVERDQSYFIYGVPRERLPRLLLPDGWLSKEEVREIASNAGLPVADKTDSQELCFAGEGDYRQALGRRGEPGPILDTAGHRLGTHKGIENYTLGQRRGLGVALGEPRYVVRIDPLENSITIAPRHEAFRRRVAAGELNVLQPAALRGGARLGGKVRSYGAIELCNVAEVGKNYLVVEFDEPQFAPTPGQHLVLYDERGRIVAGGTIKDRVEEKGSLDGRDCSVQ